MCAAEPVYIPLSADELREGLAAGFRPLDSATQMPPCALCSTAKAAWIMEDMPVCTDDAHRGTTSVPKEAAAAANAVLAGLAGLVKATRHAPFVDGRPIFCSMRAMSCSALGVVTVRGSPYCNRHFVDMAPQYAKAAILDARRAVQTEGEPLCAVCLERRVNRIVQPCKHAVLCDTCLADITRAQKAGLRCPMCQAFVASSDAVFF